MKRIKNPKMSKTRALAVARLLKKARQLMNNDGEHWIKGHLSMASEGGMRHCAIGGLVKAASPVNSSMPYASQAVAESDYFFSRNKQIAPVLRDATVLLAQTVTGRSLTTTERFETPFGPMNPLAYYLESVSGGEDDDPLFRFAEDIVVAFNDYEATTWEEVDRAFRRAEARARKIAAA